MIEDHGGVRGGVYEISGFLPVKLLNAGGLTWCHQFKSMYVICKVLPVGAGLENAATGCCFNFAYRHKLSNKMQFSKLRFHIRVTELVAQCFIYCLFVCMNLPDVWLIISAFGAIRGGDEPDSDLQQKQNRLRRQTETRVSAWRALWRAASGWFVFLFSCFCTQAAKSFRNAAASISCKTRMLHSNPPPHPTPPPSPLKQAKHVLPHYVIVYAQGQSCWRRPGVISLTRHCEQSSRDHPTLLHLSLHAEQGFNSTPLAHSCLSFQTCLITHELNKSTLRNHVQRRVNWSFNFHKWHKPFSLNGKEGHH